MKLPERILFVGVHCDDIELFAGGLLNLACRSKREIWVMVFSDHRGIVSDTAANDARDEFTTNMEKLGETHGMAVRDHCDRMLRACSGHFESERGYIYERLEALRDAYDLIVSHPPSDTNQDHKQVAAEVARVFKGHGSVIAGEFPNNDLGDFKADVYVSLEAQDVAAKVEMAGRYRSQTFDGRPYFSQTVLSGLATVRGSQIRTEFAEAFSVVRLRVG